MTSFPLSLIRPDLRDFTGYSSARTSFSGPPATVWLNANESAEANQADPTGRSRRYPQPQPQQLQRALGRYLGANADQLMMARGSDEAIDVVVRGLCRPGSADGVVICSPTFGMYAVAAALHGVPVHDVPQLDRNTHFEHDLDAVASTAERTGSKVVFLASPGNPSGSTISRSQVLELVQALGDNALVVLDEAYLDFAESQSASAGSLSMISTIRQHPTLAVLRTMSKAHGMAGARLGALAAHPELIATLRRVQAPYPIPAPVDDLVQKALCPQALHNTRDRVASTVQRRQRLHTIVGSHPDVRTVYESHANFVLARCADVDTVLSAVASHGIAVRDLRHLPGLQDAIRVSVGTSDELDALALALGHQAPTQQQTTDRHERKR